MKNLNDLFSNSPFAPRPQAVEEQGLRAALRAQALAGEADEWRKTRAILADYLADLGAQREERSAAGRMVARRVDACQHGRRQGRLWPSMGFDALDG